MEAEDRAFASAVQAGRRWSMKGLNTVDDLRYAKYASWRTEAQRRCRLVGEPSVVSRLPPAVDVRAIRERLGMMLGEKPVTQEAFARRFGFSLSAVRDWEQGRCVPDPASRVLLLVIDANPHAVDAVIDAAGEYGQDLHPPELRIAG